MTTSTAPRTADQVLSDIVTAAGTLVPHPTCVEHFTWNAAVRGFIAGLDEEVTEAEARELTDDACGVCGQPYGEHCQDCFCCPGAHDEGCGW